jgi:hypothetical protein
MFAGNTEPRPRVFFMIIFVLAEQPRLSVSPFPDIR